MKNKDVLTAELANTYGCHACKNQVTDDEYLTSHGRFMSRNCQTARSPAKRND